MCTWWFHGQAWGTASIRCLNATVYTHWCTHRAVILLGKQVDFVPHAKSISGSSPLAMVARVQADNKPTWQIIEEAITTLKNEGPAALNLTKLETTIHNAEGYIKNYIDALGSNINLHTTTKVDAAQAVQQHCHSSNFNCSPQFPKEYSNHMNGISSTLF